MSKLYKISYIKLIRQFSTGFLFIASQFHFEDPFNVKYRQITMNNI